MTTTPEQRAELAADIEDAVLDYRRIFPPPFTLAPNLELAVRALTAIREMEARPRVQHAWTDVDKAFCGDPTARPWQPPTQDAALAVPVCALCHRRVAHLRADERDAARRQVEAVRGVLARWQVEGYSALIRRIHRALAGDPP